MKEYTTPGIKDEKTKEMILEKEGLKSDEKKSEEDTSINEDEKKTEEKEEFNYKEELEKLRETTQNYKEGMMSAKAKLKELKKEEVEEEEENLDLSSVVEELDKRQQKREQERLVIQNKSLIEDTLSNLTSNEDEKELVKWFYENKINKTGSDFKSIKEDLDMARLLANKGRLEKENSTLKDVLTNKQTTSTSPEFSGEKIKSKKSNLSDADKSFISKVNSRRLKQGLKPLKVEDFN